MIWVAGRSPTLVSHSLRGVAMNLKATTLTYLAIALYPYEYGNHICIVNNSFIIKILRAPL
jgi:hypothetical protein